MKKVIVVIALACPNIIGMKLTVNNKLLTSFLGYFAHSRKLTTAPYSTYKCDKKCPHFTEGEDCKDKVYKEIFIKAQNNVLEEARKLALKIFIKDMTPFNYWKKRKIIIDLLEKGADPNVTFNLSRDYYLLDIAVWLNDIELAKLALQKGAFVNTDSDIQPLFRARTLQMAKLLINEGANFNLLDSDNLSVLYYCLNPNYEPELLSYYAQFKSIYVNNENNLWHYLAYNICRYEDRQEVLKGLMKKMEILYTIDPHGLIIVNPQGQSCLAIVHSIRAQLLKSENVDWGAVSACNVFMHFAHHLINRH